MSPVRLLAPTRLVIQVWLIAWAATVPLFHIHIPDTTDRWTALHSGGAHTVFTPDLPGEFSPPFHDNQPGHSRHLSQRVVNSPELGFAILDEPDDRKAKALHLLGASYPYPYPDTILPHTILVVSEQPFHPQLSEALPGSRAPPYLIDS